MDVLRLGSAFAFVFGLLGIFWAYAKLRNRPLSRSWPLQFWSNKPTVGRADPMPAVALSVIRQVTLTPTHKLHLIGSGRERFLVCTHPQGCTPIPMGADLSYGSSLERREKGLTDAA